MSGNIEELWCRMTEDRQSAEASARQAAEQEKREYYDLENNSKRIKVLSWMRQKNNDSIGKNAGGYCSTIKTSYRRRTYH